MDVKCFHWRCSSQEKDFHLVASSANAWDMWPSSAKGMRCSEKVTDENKAMHGKACKQDGKGHGAWSKECPKRMGLVNKLRERKSIMKDTEQGTPVPETTIQVLWCEEV